MDEKQTHSNESPFVKAGFLSRLFICWISPLLNAGSKRPLTEADLYDPLPDEQAEILTDQLENEWAIEKKKEHPSLVKAITRIYWSRVVLLGLLMALQEVLRTIVPLLISQLTKYFDGRSTLRHALIYASLICLCVSINCIIIHPYFLNIVRLGIKMRLATSGLIYKKSLKLNLNGINSFSSGQLLNLISNDGARLEMCLYYFPYFVIAPIQALIIVYILVSSINVSILSGMVILIIAVPLQSFLGKLFDILRRIASKKGDRRITILNEILGGIKIIKMYCWEEPFKNVISYLRKKEIEYQSHLYTISSFNTIVDLTLPSLMTFTSVAFFIYLTNAPLEPAFVILAASYSSRISNAIGNNLIKAVMMAIGANVSIKRIQDYLLKDEIKKTNTLQNVLNPHVIVKNFNAKWSKKTDQFTLKNVSFEIKQNGLVAIVGPIGSGKSSLLMGLLEEMEKTTGILDVQGTVFYVPQEPWIFTASIRQNILFGKPYNKEKFDRVLKLCCLEQDIETFPNEDLTIVGEKGVNLSGGQRARLSVARALYNDAQIFLFDDPLSAVDANVARNLFTNCINKLSKSKICILVTHQIHFLVNVDQILYLDNGYMKYYGNFANLLSSGLLEEIKLTISMMSKYAAKNRSRKSFRAKGSIKAPSDVENVFRESIVNSDLSLTDAKNFSSSAEFIDLKSINSTENLSEEFEEEEEASNEEKFINNKLNESEFEEKRKIGLLSWKTYFIYLKSGGGVLGAFLNLLIFAVSHALLVSSDYWISQWSSVEKKSSRLLSNSTFNKQSVDKFNQQRNYYFFYYCLIIFAAFGACCLRVLLFFCMSVRASKNLHKSMFEKVIETRVRFFDLNPTGRIMNRFSKDIGVIDENIPITVLDFMNLLMKVLGSIGFVISMNHYTILPLIPLIGLFFYIRNYFLKISMEMKRIEAIVRSPIYIHINNTLSGITTVRASNMQSILKSEFFKHNNRHTGAVSTYLFLKRWVAIRLDWIATLFVYIALYSCVVLKERNFLSFDSGRVGMMMVYLVELVGLFQWAIRLSCDVENLMTAVERVLEYSSLDSEPLNKGNKRAPIGWPSKGEIEFENIHLRYDKNLPCVLNNLSFKIKSGEKIGIVGRTGAGKSSIIQTLFRMTEPHQGSIYIDGVNIQDLSLHELRSKLSIIPQEPTLFSGTIRSNLDPLDEYTDDVLWQSLEKAQLKDIVKEMKHGLDSPVHKAGSNLSVGQKQLICLARAIIKKSKILLIDEATANVDLKTDSLVQSAIRECFQNSTVITIAHRLNTIIDSKKILCLNNGRVENFEQPYDLIENKSSVLYEMMCSLNKQEKERLVEMAREAYNHSDVSRKPPNPSVSSINSIFNETNSELE